MKSKRIIVKSCVHTSAKGNLVTKKQRTEFQGSTNDLTFLLEIFLIRIPPSFCFLFKTTRNLHYK